MYSSQLTTAKHTNSKDEKNNAKSLVFENKAFKKYADHSTNQVQISPMPFYVQSTDTVLLMKSTNNFSTIIAYNHKKDTYNENYIKLPTDVSLSNHVMCYDSFLSIIYIFGGVKPNFMEYHLSKKYWNVVNDQRVKSVFSTGKWSNILMIENEFHVCGGNRNINHMIWNEFEQKFIIVFSFPSVFYGAQLIYNENSKQLMIIGGVWNHSKYPNSIWFGRRISEKSYHWSISEEMCLHAGLFGFGCVFFSELNIALCFGGYVYFNVLSNAVFICDFNNMTVKKIDVIQCPEKAFYHSLIIESDIHLFSTHYQDVNGGYHGSLKRSNCTGHWSISCFCFEEICYELDIFLKAFLPVFEIKEFGCDIGSVVLSYVSMVAWEYWKMQQQLL